MKKLLERKNWFLALSLLVICAFWAFSLLTIDPKIALPENMSTIFWSAIKSRIWILGIIALLLFFEHETLSGIGFKRQNIGMQMGAGVISAIALFVIINFGLMQLLLYINPDTQSFSSVVRLISQPENLPYWLIMGVFAGGFSEEIIRVFILTRFEKGLGKIGLIIAIILGSIIFGISHLYQGINGAIAAGVIGLTYCLLYLRKRSLMEIIVSHALYDVLSILLAFIFYSL